MTEFFVKNLDIESGAAIAIINPQVAALMGIHPGDRIEIKGKGKKTIAIVNLSNSVEQNQIGLTKDLHDEIKMSDGTAVQISVLPKPMSLIAIANRLNGVRLSASDAYEIIRDVVDKRLENAEIAAFVVSLHMLPLDLEETVYLSDAMVKTGETLKLNRKRIFDKHSIGGVPGDKTSLLVVPIVAAAGLTIPKTSSRAITSAAGTADRAEVLMPVSLDVSEVRRVVEKTNGCLVWGGAVHLAPADDIFIRAEYPFSIDPLMLPSIISKKKAVGSTHMVLDLPTGPTVKVKNESEGKALVQEFVALGNRMGIHIEGALTNGTQPIGYTIGAAAEAREALETISGKRKAIDLIEKATSLAGILLEMAGKKNGKELARKILDSGLAEKKLREIIEEQGGDPKIRPEDIQVGDHKEEFFADRDGVVLEINNLVLANIVKLAGAPIDKKAALILNKKLFDSVKKGELLFTVYSDSAPALKKAMAYAKENGPIIIGNKNRMLLRHIKMHEGPNGFIIER